MVTSEDMYTEKKEIDVSYVIVSYANKTKHNTNSIKEMYYFHRLCYNFRVRMFMWIWAPLWYAQITADAHSFG